jgi:hypothetical protein
VDCLANARNDERKTATPVIARSGSDEAIQNPFAERLDGRVASRSLSSGAHSRDPLARNDRLKSAYRKDLSNQDSDLRSELVFLRGFQL